MLRDTSKQIAQTRGGYSSLPQRSALSASAVYDIYFSFWAATLQGTMFAAREHFTQKLLVAVQVQQSMRLLNAPCLGLCLAPPASSPSRRFQELATPPASELCRHGCCA